MQLNCETQKSLKGATEFFKVNVTLPFFAILFTTSKIITLHFKRAMSWSYR